MAKPLVSFAAAALLAFAASCGAPETKDLDFVNADGTTIGLSRERSSMKAGQPLSIQSGVEAVFTLAQPARVLEACDLYVRLRGTGALRVSVIDAAKPIKSSSSSLIGGRTSEVRFGVPAGAAIAAIKLAALEGAELEAIGLAVPRRGLFASESLVSFDEATSVRIGTGTGLPEAVSTPALGRGSVVVDLFKEGALTVRAEGPGRGSVIVAAAARPGRPLALPLSALGNPESLEVTSSAGISKVYFVDGKGFPPSDLYAILEAPAPEGNYSAFAWDLFPDTIVLDFMDYATQDRYLKRLAFFAEKPGFRGRLASDREIEALHGWNAHDYSSETLSRFYSQAARLRFTLAPEELELRDILVSRGLVIPSNGTYLPGRGALISVSRESGDRLRRLFIDHESSHALLFQDKAYESLSEKLWRSLDSDSRWFWKTHFEWREYDVTDEFLCLNELQAYLVQQPLGAVRGYYDTLALRLAKAYPSREARLAAGSARYSEGAFGMASSLSRYLEAEYGISGGEFGRITGFKATPR